MCVGDSKSLLVHICSDLGRRDKGRGPRGFAAALWGVGVGKEEEAGPGKEGRGQGWLYQRFLV